MTNIEKKNLLDTEEGKINDVVVPKGIDMETYTFKRKTFNLQDIPMEFRDIFIRWNNDMMNMGKSSSTIYGLLDLGKRFVLYTYEHFGISSPSNLKRKHIIDFYNSLIVRVQQFDMQNGITCESAYSYGTGTHTFLAYCVESENIELNLASCKPEDFVSKKPLFYFTDQSRLTEYKAWKEKNTKEKPIPYTELEHILLASNRWGNYAGRAIKILLGTGLRVSELLMLEKDCLIPVDPKEETKIAKAMQESGMEISPKELHWLKYKTIKKKSLLPQEGTPLLISKEVVRAIKEQINHSKKLLQKLNATPEIMNRIFIGNHNGQLTNTSDSALRNMIRRKSKKDNIPYANPHRYRHTYATILYDKGVSVHYIQQYLNHLYSDTTIGYTHSSPEKQIKKYETFANAKVLEGGAKERATGVQERLKEAFVHPEYEVMAIESQCELIDLILEEESLGIHVMDHGCCTLPKLSDCPNSFTDINSCLEEHCNEFVSTEHSIPFLSDLIKYKEKSIEHLKKAGFSSAVEYQRKKLDKTTDIFEKLKRGQYGK